MKQSKKVIGIALCCFIIISLFGFNGDKKNFEVSKNIDIFSSLFKELNQFYVDSIEPEKVIRTGIDAMLSSLDPYTEYIPESDTNNDIKLLRTGEYGGIGSIISFRTKDSCIIINEPYENTPASRGGLKAGDKLLQIDTISMLGETTQRASELLQGEIGTPVKIKVAREENDEPLTFELKREKIQVNPVTYYGIVGNNIGYIYLSTFNNKTSSEVKKAFVSLKKDYNISSLVLDLRGNTGGLMDEAIQLLSLFVPRGTEVLSTKGKISQQNRTYRTTSAPLDKEIPLVVLVNGESASASEIVAGALQDLDRAVLVGERTYGKGLVQTVRKISYNGQLKLTTAKYYIPSGRCIQEIDYSKRKENGKLVKTPDSLSVAFQTANGRTVYSGKGILPDFTIEPKKMHNISAYMIRDYIFLEYAARYLRHHTSIAPVQEFHITDGDYEEFCEFTQKKEFTYDKKSIELLNDLKEMAEFEGYMEETKEDFANLEKKFQHDIKRDLTAYKDEIKEMIETEIIKQYYFQKGVIIYALKNDTNLKKAIEVFNDSAQYKKTLKK